MPIVGAEGSGDDLARFIALTRLGRLDRAAVRVVTSRPVHIHKVLGRYELTVCAVDDEKESVLGRVQDYLPLLPIYLQIGENYGLRGRVIPVVAGRFLIVPHILAGVGIERDER